MLQDLQNITLYTIDLGDVVVALVVAFGCGFLISLVYRWTYRGTSYSPSFVRSMIFLAMITAVVLGTSQAEPSPVRPMAMWTATGASTKPMTMMTGPVTMGGNSLCSIPDPKIRTRILSKT